jgi:hypothetical protein
VVRFAINFLGRPGHTGEHVLKAPDVNTQIPYNQGITEEFASPYTDDNRKFTTSTNRKRNIGERVVTQVLQGHLPQIREELVRRVLEELPQGTAEAGGHDGATAGPADLLRGVAAIQAGGTQKEILRALLDGVAQHAGRTALFVIKGGAATGWQGRGFEDNDGVKEFTLDVRRGLPERVLQEKAPFSGQVLDMDPRFIDRFGGPADDHIVMLPLLLKDKVAAILYADCGLDKDRLDTASVELLVVSTSAWLELVSLRKQTPREGAPYADSAPAAAAMQAAPSFNDPFAGHAPRHTASASAAYEAPAEPAHAEVVSAAAAAAGVDPAGSVGHAAPALSDEDADVHRKAQRLRACWWTRSNSTTRPKLRPQEQGFVRSAEGRHRQEPRHLQEALWKYGGGKRLLSAGGDRSEPRRRRYFSDGTQFPAVDIKRVVLPKTHSSHRCRNHQRRPVSFATGFRKTVR